MKYLRTALAQQGQEPVAYMDNDGNISDNNDHGTFNTPLYAAPAPQAQPVAAQDHCEQHLDMVAQPLTEPEIHALAHRKATRYTYTAKRSEVMYGFSESHIVDFVRAIEKEGGL